MQRLAATMQLPAHDMAGYLDIAAETTGYVYTLLSIDKEDGGSEYVLEVYEPDGTHLFDQDCVYAARIGVDQWRSMFSLNCETLLGPGQRTEPGISEWIPSAPAPQ